MCAVCVSECMYICELHAHRLSEVVIEGVTFPETGYRLFVDVMCILGIEPVSSEREVSIQNH